MPGRVGLATPLGLAGSSLLDLDDLARFVVACQEDSLAKAAGERRISPSSLSASLAGLRDGAAQPGAPAQISLRHGIDAAGPTRLDREIVAFLPPSDVTRLVASGELAIRTVQNPRIVRTLQIVYSTARVLTEAERELVRLLRTQLAGSETSIGG